MPPKLVRVAPDTNAVNVTADNASFYFDETINDRGSGAQELDSYFLLSPSDGAAHVSWHRSRIDIRPRKGFRPNTAYVVTMLPGLGDLTGNKMKTGATLVFSTGATIPREKITGIAFDWVAERPAPNAYIEAVTPDSITYLAQSDTSGRFTLGPLPAGNYLVRAIIDQNNNRALDRAEAFDSVRVRVPQAGLLELLTAPRDTMAALLAEVTASDSVTLNVTFDRVVDPAQSLTAASFRLVGADSALVPIVSALTASQQHGADSLVLKTRVDSARRADSLAGRPLVPADAPRPGQAAPLKPSRPAPYKSITLKLGRALPPNTPFRLSVTGAKALSGKTQPSERSFTTPRPAPPPPVDSAARKGSTAPPARPPSSPRR